MHAIKEKHNIALFTVVLFEFLPIFENTLPSMLSQFCPSILLIFHLEDLHDLKQNHVNQTDGCKTGA
jgi:hypothetical protein